MNRLLIWINGLFKGTPDSPSSKRFIGIVSSLSLIVVLFINTLTCGAVAPADNIVNAVALLAFGCLGLTSIDNYTKVKTENIKPTESDSTIVE
jgi:hypothetical protein